MIRNPVPPTAEPAPAVYTLGTADGLQIQVSSHGGRWLSCRVPLPDGSRREAILGHTTAAEHLHEPGFFGAIVGRYANRLAGAAFTLDGRHHALPANEGANQLHGGPEGFDRRAWTVVDHGPRHLRLALHSPDGDQGYPGALDAEVEYRLDPAQPALTLRFGARVTAPCPVSLTSHPYFNLDGDAASVQEHRLRVAATAMLPVRADMIPTGELAAVQGTAFDLRQARRIGDGLGRDEPQLLLAGGYDHCYALDAGAARGELAAAELMAGDGRLAMRLYTDYPGLQVCSGNFVQNSRGRDGRPFRRHAGIALEPQFFPDAPNHPAWREQGCVLRPGQRLSRFMRLEFDA
ncbi:aldose epimerase family protein [Roseateles saccharophilus]|uniref:Aldose 1-epimerase n=1 Tax=Roseateles saccharophilus TaxID=304 RepID=A0A4R3VC08_ROSSA|nr:aldose epimerase family protein [Roseateles saccharophilus]MDG0831816.1 galactose mutarotase [Roseateles saccharophilus]TCV01162.1 aldose 1-epimerase [Roseateles saccharophilus]